MLYQKKKKYMKTERRIYAFVLLVIIALFLMRVYEGNIEAAENAGLLIRLSDQYQMGTVYDRNENAIVRGTDGGMEWTRNQEEQEAMAGLFGPALEDTYASRMTIWGMAPELFGYNDTRLDLKDLLRPGKARVGGSIELTIDKELQTFICSLLKQKGVENAAVVVSNWRTGEILAAVSLPASLPGEAEEKISNIFSQLYSPGSTIKIILAAAALSIAPDLADFEYDCTAENHIFHTKQGDYRVSCAGNVYHGRVDMAEAIADSCNGYFISLLQQIPEDELAEELKNWGFDTTISFDQFSYWDQTFSGEDASEIEYLLGAIGQGNCSITPIGLNLCTNVLLNSGRLQEPVVIQKRSASPDDDMRSCLSGKSYEVCSEMTADRVKEMMLGVTSYGTGTDFGMNGFAAKTGTAQKADEEGNPSDFYTVWTTGGLTDEESPYSVTVCFDNVSSDIRSTYAGKTAKEILEYMTGGEN